MDKNFLFAHVKLITKVFLYLLGLQWLGKILFVIFHFQKFNDLSMQNKLGLFWAGLRMDISVASYLIALLILILILNHFINVNKFLKGFFIISSLLLILIQTVDIEVFRAWQFRLDTTPLKYLQYPKEALASTASSPLFSLLIICLIQIAFAILMYKYYLPSLVSYGNKGKLYSVLLHLLGVGLLIIPIRGGLQLAPMNQSAAYFSNDNFANQAALNPTFNFFHSIASADIKTNPFVHLPANEAKKIVDGLFLDNGKTKSIIKTIRPNVLIITWESLTAKALNQKFTNKTVEVLPHLARLSKNSIYFSNCYASGDRSDKGMVAILAGYPAQPIASIIKNPSKTRKLPSLAKSFKENGYNTAWYYGGEPEFANIKSYIVGGGFEKVISKSEFPDAETQSTKWGANDKKVFERLQNDLEQIKQPFFVNMFTLSSHEPFEIPDYQAIDGEDETSKFLNALHYTDLQLYNFLEQAKKKSWYQNTLIVIVADHGHRLPENDDKFWEFKVPLIFTGGAITQSPLIISNICSQNDIAKTILNQLNIPSKDYKWSKDLFSTSYKNFAYFSFNNGFGYLDQDGTALYNNNSKKVMIKNASELPLIKGKAYLQTSFDDYLSK